MAKLAIIYITVGLFMAAYGLSFYWQRHAAQTWLPASANIVSSAVNFSTGSKGNTYWPSVSYHYLVAGKMRAGSTIRFGPAAVSRMEAEATVRKFPKGAEVVVYVNPLNPNESVLDRENISGAAKWIFCLSAFFSIGGGYFAYTIISEKFNFHSPRIPPL